MTSKESIYEFTPSEGGIFVEIYLPKRSEYQGTLYEALTEGFKVTKVRDHFRNNGEDVRGFLKDHYADEYTDAKVENMSQVFFGYSMYEVDGVFWDDDIEEIIEERTQVIRIIFRPNFDQIPSDFPHRKKARIVKDYLRYSGGRENFASEYLENKEVSSEDRLSIKRITDYLRAWECEVALFTFGYIVYEICKRIQKINEEQGQKIEKEIWVTSLWNLSINRVLSLKK